MPVVNDELWSRNVDLSITGNVVPYYGVLTRNATWTENDGTEYAVLPTSRLQYNLDFYISEMSNWNFDFTMLPDINPDFLYANIWVRIGSDFDKTTHKWKTLYETHKWVIKIFIVQADMGDGTNLFAFQSYKVESFRIYKTSTTTSNDPYEEPYKDFRTTGSGSNISYNGTTYIIYKVVNNGNQYVIYPFADGVNVLTYEGKQYIVKSYDSKTKKYTLTLQSDKKDYVFDQDKLKTQVSYNAIVDSLKSIYLGKRIILNSQIYEVTDLLKDHMITVKSIKDGNVIETSFTDLNKSIADDKPLDTYVVNVAAEGSGTAAYFMPMNLNIGMFATGGNQSWFSFVGDFDENTGIHSSIVIDSSTLEDTLGFLNTTYIFEESGQPTSAQISTLLDAADMPINDNYENISGISERIYIKNKLIYKDTIRLSDMQATPAMQDRITYNSVQIGETKTENNYSFLEMNTGMVYVVGEDRSTRPANVVIREVISPSAMLLGVKKVVITNAYNPISYYDKLTDTGYILAWKDSRLVYAKSTDMSNWSDEKVILISDNKLFTVATPDSVGAFAINDIAHDNNAIVTKRKYYISLSSNNKQPVSNTNAWKPKEIDTIQKQIFALLETQSGELILSYYDKDKVVKTIGIKLE